MKKPGRFLGYLIIGLLISSCCNQSDSYNGDIISTLNIEGDYDYLHHHCFKMDDNVCIRDDSTYFALFQINADTLCNDIVLPSIDFSKHTLLVYPRNDDKRIYYHKNVIIDSANKKVTYTISTTKCFCPDACRSWSLNMVIIPKIAHEFTVEFK